MNAENYAVRSVTSNQTTLHENLETLVFKYLETDYLRPIASHTQTAFEKADFFVKQRNAPVVLDSGCGQGLSSLFLAKKYPECSVIAIDKSETRLSKIKNIPENVFFVRAELLDFWRLVSNVSWNVLFHALFYPNPWPKSSEAKRRFHLSPVFPSLLNICPHLELRTNWKIYAEEFFCACRIYLKAKGLSEKRNLSVSEFCPEIPETAFEKKYKEANQTLYKVVLSEA